MGMQRNWYALECGTVLDLDDVVGFIESQQVVILRSGARVSVCVDCNLAEALNAGEFVSDDDD